MEGFSQSLPPCRSVCERARAGCGPIMGYYAFTWPDRMQCDQFPELNNPEGVLCMERNLTDAERIEFGTTSKAASGVGEKPGSGGVALEDRATLRDRSMATRADGGGDVSSRALATSGARLECSCGCRHPFVSVVANNDSQLTQISTLGFQGCALPCHSIHFQTEGDRRFVDFWLWLWSILCAVSTLATMLTYLTNPSRFQYPGQPIIYLSTCYFFVAIGYILRMVVGHESVACTEVTALVRGGDTHQRGLFTTASILQFSLSGQASCATVFLLTYYFGMASSVWWVVLTVTWFLAAGLKWGNEAITKYTQVFHFVAWVLPGVQTGVVLMLRAVDGDPIGGLCSVGSTNDSNLTYFLLLPLCIYFCVGTFFLLSGFIALCRIRHVIKFQPRARTDKLEKLMIKLGIFGLLYTVPAIVVIACLAHELRWRRVWQLGVACRCDWHNDNDEEVGGRRHPLVWIPPTPEYAIFMLKYFMSLIVGITSGFWIWSSKTLDAWRRVCNGRKPPVPHQPPTAPAGSEKLINWVVPNVHSPSQFSLKSLPSRSAHTNFYDQFDADPRQTQFCPVVRGTSSGIGGSTATSSAYANTTSGGGDFADHNSDTANVNRGFIFNSGEFNGVAPLGGSTAPTGIF
uniref:G_PROTEIN_RECEP_F2_4 domain-containing protein n=1 Tax=Mesocestoides corti TaxID=53468 RepID=A0A5K3FZJ2_MESCO